MGQLSYNNHVIALKTCSLYNHVPMHYNSVKSHDSLFVSK